MLTSTVGEQSMTKTIKLSNEILLGSVVELVTLGKRVKINISGSSMRPFLSDGDTVLLEKIAFENIRLGHIILGIYHNSYVLHRVIRKEASYILIAGDNNFNRIEKINLNDICAVATSLIIDDKNIDLTNRSARMKGMAWYYLRSFRKLYSKVFMKNYKNYDYETKARFNFKRNGK